MKAMNYIVLEDCIAELKSLQKGWYKQFIVEEVKVYGHWWNRVKYHRDVLDVYAAEDYLKSRKLELVCWEAYIIGIDYKGKRLPLELLEAIGSTLFCCNGKGCFNTYTCFVMPTKEWLDEMMVE